MHTVRGNGIAGIKRRRRDLSSDGVKNFATTLGRGRLKEDLESSTWRRHLGNIIDSSLSEVVMGKPFAQASKLAYDESLGLIRFSHSDDDEVMFRMPQRTKELDLVSRLEKDKFEAFFVESLKVRKIGFKHVLEKRKGYYKACMNLGLLSSDLTNKIACRKFLIKNEEEIFTDAGDGVRIYPDGVASPAMLYLTRRSLEDLRMFSLDDSWRKI
ncbi:hypothetical protein Tco_1576414 [Tanacetum coccineum]